MKWTRKTAKQILIAGAAVSSSKTASAAGAAGAAGAVGAAAGLGLELAPFVIGAVGATVVITAQRPQSRGSAWAHSVVSVFAGGIGGPWAAQTGNALAMHYLKTPDLNTLLTQLLAAGLLSAGWPYFGPLLWDIVRKRLAALAGSDKPPAKGDTNAGT
jgi:hypothetical protein